MILKLSFVVVFNTFLISFYFTLVESVPEDYCLSPLNTSDCGRLPTPVFYYYKPGSRCEIKIWRGCPTENLFSNEYHCSHHCIGKLWSSEQGKTAGAIWARPANDMLIGPKHRCDVPIDTSQCKQAKQLVYTYDNKKKKCTEVTYYGCPTANKFRDKDECEDECEKSKAQWEHEVNNLDLKELQMLNNMLDEVNNEIVPDNEDLKKNVNNSKIRPHTVKDYDEATDVPDDETNKVDNESKEPSDKSEKPTKKSEGPTNKPEEPTEKPRETPEKPEEPTEKQEEPTEKPVEPTAKQEEPTAKQEEPTEKPGEPTDEPEETTKGEESETKSETDTVVASTDSVQENPAAAEATTKEPDSTKRTRRKRSTRTVKEGDVVREGNEFYYQQ